MVLLFLALTILCGESAGVSLSLLVRRGVRFFDIAGAMIPPDMSYGRIVLAPLWATVQMSLAGTGIGAVLGLVGAPLPVPISILMPGCVFRSRQSSISSALSRL